MITFAASREIPSHTGLRPTPPSDFKFQVSAFPQPPSPRLSTPVSRTNRPISVIPQLRDLGLRLAWVACFLGFECRAPGAGGYDALGAAG
jgi:hypothetical protein